MRLKKLKKEKTKNKKKQKNNIFAINNNGQKLIKNLAIDSFETEKEIMKTFGSIVIWSSSYLRQHFDEDDCYLKPFYKGYLTRITNKISEILEKFKIVAITNYEEINALIDGIKLDYFIISFFQDKKQYYRFGQDVSYADFYLVFSRMAIVFEMIKQYTWKFKTVKLREELLEFYEFYMGFQKFWIRDIDENIPALIQKMK